MTSPAAAAALPRRSLAAAAVAIAIGIALRVAATYPVHKYSADADCLNGGLVALRITDGHLPVWYTPRRAGALVCYAHETVFQVLGPTR